MLMIRYDQMGKMISYHLSVQIAYSSVFQIQIPNTQRPMTKFVEEILRMLYEYRSFKILEMNVKEAFLEKPFL